jgi:hypothetical protein
MGDGPQATRDAATPRDSSTTPEAGGEDTGGGHPEAGPGDSSTKEAAGGDSSTGIDAGPLAYVYTNGVLDKTDWPFDYSYGSPVENFTDTTDPEPGHALDFSMSGGGWQPAAMGYSAPPYGLDLSHYTYMTFDINPRSTESPYDMQWHYIGDVGGGTTDFEASAYVPDVTEWVGPLTELHWNTVKIPMAAFGVLDSVHTYKFFIRNNGGNGVFLLDNVGFVPGDFGWAYAGDSGPLSGWVDASTEATANYAYQPTDFSSALVSLNGGIAPGTSATSKNVVKLSVTSKGGMLRLNNTSGYSIANYDHFTFGAVPTKTGYSYRVQFYDTAGKAVGSAVDPSLSGGHDWGVNTQFWTTYCVPLSAFGALGHTIGGLSIQDDSGASANTIYISAIGFYK